MFGRFPLLLVPETDTKGDTPLVLFASLHGKMASRTLLSKIYEVKKNNQLYLCNKKSVVVTHTRGKKWKTRAILRYFVLHFFFVIIKQPNTNSFSSTSFLELDICSCVLTYHTI